MSWNDPCNDGCGNSKRDCTCPEVSKIVLPKITGKIMFQFDDDEPQLIAHIPDYSEFNITLKQRKPDGPLFDPGTSDITFTSPEGKRFKLFISDIEPEKS